MTTIPPTRPALELLSRLLSELPASEVCLVIKHFEAGIRDGSFRAVPVEGQVFPLTFLAENGEEETRELNDELVEVSAGWSAWLARMRRDSRLAIMASTRTVVTSQARLDEKLDDFTALAKLRRDLLGANARTKPAPTKPRVKAAKNAPESVIKITPTKAGPPTAAPPATDRSTAPHPAKSPADLTGHPEPQVPVNPGDGPGTPAQSPPPN